MMKFVKYIIPIIIVLIIGALSYLAALNLDLLNRNSGAFTVLFSAVVALATVVYAILTWRLVTETKEMREVQTEPKIFVMELSHLSIFLG